MTTSVIAIVIALVGITSIGFLTFQDLNALSLISFISMFYVLCFMIVKRNHAADRRLEGAIENIGDGLAIYDNNDRLVLCNTPYLEMFAPIKDVLVVGTHYKDILNTGLERGFYPPKGQNADAWLHARLEMRKENKASREERLNDGRWILIRESKNQDGYRVSIRTDITQMRLREERLSQLYRAVDQSASMVFVTDYQGSIEYVNKRFIEETGYDIDEIIGNSPNLYTGGVTKELEYRDIWKTISTGGVWRGEINRQRRNGDLFWVFSTISPIEDAHGVVTHYVAIEDDVTKRKKAEETLLLAKDDAILANKSKTEFLMNMSHELRTPLNHIIGFSDMLKAQPVDKLKQEKFDQYLGCIFDAGNHLLEIVNAIMEAAEIDAGTVKLVKKDFNPADLVAACSTSLDGRMRAANVYFQGEISEETSIVHGDDIRLQQVLFNLLTNAINFSKPGDTIVLSAHPIENNMYEFAIKDTGIGIAPDKQKDIFALFEQADTSLTRRQQGMGLGLALAKHLTDLHDGHLSFESSEGVGTTFFVHIPM